MNTKLFFASLFLGTILSATAQNTSFETSEGFTLGELNGQKGWKVFGDLVSIVNSNDAPAGDRTLDVFADNSLNLVKFISPDYAITDAKVTVSLDLFFDSNLGDLRIEAHDIVFGNSYTTSSLDFLSTRVIKAVRESTIPGGGGVVETIGTYDIGKWTNLKLDYDFNASTIKYYLDGVLLYTGTTIGGYTQVDKLEFWYYAPTNPGGYRNFSLDNLKVGPTGTLNIKENELASQFSVYPNPATNIINVSNKNAKITSVTLTDLNGRTVKQESFNGVFNATINTIDLSAGMYLMTIRSSEGSATKKIVKN